MYRRGIFELVVLATLAAVSAASAATNLPPGHSPPILGNPPSVIGAAVVGGSLTADPGTWSGPIEKKSYQWARCDSSGGACSAVSMATSAAYLVAADNVGSTLRVTVFATNKNGSTMATSEATAVVVDPTTTTTPPPPPPAPSGTVLKRIDYEYPSATGVDPTQAFWQCADNTPSDGATRGTLSADATTFDSIARSGQFLNPPTALAAAFHRSACEVVTSHATKTGNDVYFALALRVPLGWSGHDDFDTSRTIVAAPDYVLVGGGGGIEVDLYTDRAALSLSTGNCVAGVGCDYDNSCGGECLGHRNNVRCDPVNGLNKLGGVSGCKIIPPGQLTQGVWHEMIIHTYETPYANGLIETWWKRKGETTWNKSVTMSGMPTLPLGTDIYGRAVTAAGFDAGSYQTWDKFGLQSWDPIRSVSINQDSNCVATTFDAASSCFN